MVNKNKRVIISTGGKFHAFHLARQLDERMLLKKIITGYPRFKLRDEGIAPNKIKSYAIPFLFEHFLSKVNIIKKIIPVNYVYKIIFDSLASRNIKNCDLFIGWSGNCLRSLKAAKKCGAICIIDRGAAHISYQNEILKSEYLKYGIDLNPIHKGIIRRELLEYDLADYILVPSKFVQRTFVEKGFDLKKVLVCPYGVDLIKFQEVPKDDNIFRIVYAGAISFQKGVQYLLQAVSELSLEDIELVLIGRIENKIMENLVKNTPNCRFIGRIPQDQLYKYYSQGTLFVQPSIQDGFAMTVVEAMSCGLPVLSTTNVGGADIINNGENGYVVKVQDAQAIAEKIIELYNNPERLNSMKLKAKETARLYTWDRYGQKITKLFLDLLN